MRGFFVGTLAFVMVAFETGDTDFALSGLGTSSLSKILEVSLSNCLLQSRGETHF